MSRSERPHLLDRPRFLGIPEVLIAAALMLCVTLEFTLGGSLNAHLLCALTGLLIIAGTRRADRVRASRRAQT